MYDPQALLRSVDSNKAVFLILGTLAVFFSLIYFAGSAMAARRDRVFSVPLVAATVWFAHNLSFLLQYHEWFQVYNHWYLKMFWFALIPETLFTAYFIQQAWQYGKDELLPAGTSEGFLVLIVSATVAGLIGWWSVKSFLNDPLYGFSFAGVSFLAPIFAFGRLLTRGDAAGQSVVAWLAYGVMNLLWLPATFLFFGPAFRTPAYLLIGAVGITCDFAMAVMIAGMGHRTAVVRSRVRRPAPRAFARRAGSPWDASAAARRGR